MRQESLPGKQTQHQKAPEEKEPVFSPQLCQHRKAEAAPSIAAEGYLKQDGLGHPRFILGG